MNSRMILPASGLMMVSLFASACSGKSESAIESKTADSTTTSPSAASADRQGTSMVRFVNAMPGSAPLDMMGDSTSLFSNVAFGDVSQFKEVRDNLVKFTVHAGSSTAALATNNETLADGNHYTIVAMSDREGGVSMRVIRDDLVPEGGKARVRVIHAAPGLDDVSLTLTGQRDALFNDVDYGSEAGFKDVAPVTTGFTVRKAEGNRSLLTQKSMAMNAGTAYTFVLAAKPNGSLTTIAFSDSATGMPMKGTQPE